MSISKDSYIYKNSLSIVFLLLTFFSIIGQTITGLHEYNEQMVKYHQPVSTIFDYLFTGHFLQATFENWESEFLQMGLFVWLTVFLRQKGSSESKEMEGKESVDREPLKHPKAPWPVNKGGWILKVYRHSLTISLFLLYFVSFMLHWYGSNKDFNQLQLLQGRPVESMFTYLTNSRLWFESFQNWQSEFLSVFAIIFLSVYLREKGSPQSKPVDAPHMENGE